MVLTWVLVISRAVCFAIAVIAIVTDSDNKADDKYRR